MFFQVFIMKNLPSAPFGNQLRKFYLPNWDYLGFMSHRYFSIPDPFSSWVAKHLNPLTANDDLWKRSSSRQRNSPEKPPGRLRLFSISNFEMKNFVVFTDQREKFILYEMKCLRTLSVWSSLWAQWSKLPHPSPVKVVMWNNCQAFSKWRQLEMKKWKTMELKQRNNL